MAIKTAFPFTNTYMNTTVTSGAGEVAKPDTVESVRGANSELVLIMSGGVRIYLDVETAVSLMQALAAAVDDLKRVTA